MHQSRLKSAAFLFVIFWALIASTAHAQKSGAWYWGDGDGTGNIAGPDLNVLYQVIAHPGVNDASIYGGYPQSRYRQDLDGNGSISGPDANVMYGWAAGNFSNRPGNPDRLLLDGTTNLSVNIGDSVTLQAYALSPASIASALRTGFGVNFQITGGNCTTGAEIYGYDVAGGSTADDWHNPTAYHYLPTRLAPDNGRAWVKVRGNSCTNGQTTIIKVYIPSDSESLVPGHRFPTELDAQLSPTNLTPVYFTITWGGLYVTSIVVNPSSTSLADGSTTHFTATCTWSNATHTDCTNDANLTWGDTGTLSQQSPTNTFLGSGAPCPAGGTGTVKATYDDGSNPAVSGTSSVTVTNPLQSVSVNPPSAIERAVIDYRLTGTCLAGTTGDITGGSTMIGGCSGPAGGPATMAWTCGSAKPPTDCTITETVSGTYKSADITLNNDPSDAIIGASCAIAGTDVQEGSSAALGCTYSWANDEGDCGNADADAQVTGTTCFKDGANGLPGVKCGNTAMNPDWTCTIAFGATITNTYSFTGQDRNETVTGVSCAIDGTNVQEGSSAALGCIYSWSNGEGICNGPGGNADTDANVTGTSCFKDGANGLPGVKCGNHAMNPDWTCTIAFGATVTNTFTFTGQDRNETVTGAVCTIAGTDVQEGSSAALGCAYSWTNDEGNCNGPGWNADTDANVTGTTCAKNDDRGLPGVKCGGTVMNPDWTCTISFGATITDTFTFTGQDRNDAVIAVSCAIAGTNVQEGSSAALGCGLYSWANGEGSCGNADADASVTGTTCSKDGNNGLPGVKCGNTAMNPDWTCTISFGATTTITYTYTGQDRNDAVIGASCSINGADVQEGSSAALGCAYSWANDEGNCNGPGWNADTDANVTGTSCFKDGANGLPGVKCGNTAMNPDWTCTISFGATIANTYTFTGQDRNDAVTGAVCTIAGTDVQEGSSAALGCLYSWSHGEGNCNGPGWNADTDANVTGTTCAKNDDRGLPGVKCGNTAMNPDWTCTIGWGATTAVTQSFTGQDRNETMIGLTCAINGTDVGEGDSAALGCAYSWSNDEGNCNGPGWNANTDAQVTGSHCAKNGADGLCKEFNCDSSDWSCGLSWGATSTVTGTYNCLNDDTILSVTIKPDSVGVVSGGTINFANNSIISWTGPHGAADACTESACNKPAKVTWADADGCGTLDTSSCLWTAGDTVCSERLSLTDANSVSLTDGATVAEGIDVCTTKPIIDNIFPMDFADRYKGNAHTDQIVTLLFNSTVITDSCVLSYVHMTCTGTDASVVAFASPTDCSLSGADVACTPPSNFNPLITYSCTVTANNTAGSTVISTGSTMTTGTALAPSAPTLGGLGGGYVGGNAYSRLTGVADGTVTYQFIDLDTPAVVPGRAYVQILQGATISEWFTSATGQLTATLPALPIKELTVGYKCGTMRCDLNTRSNNYQNYAFHTWENVDARDGVLRLTLMTNSQGYINTWNTTHQGRYRADVIGTINPDNFSTFIYPIDRSDLSQVRTRILFNKPSKLRVGLSLFAMRDIYTLMTTLISGLGTSGDSETSISLCMATETYIKSGNPKNINKYGNAGLGVVFAGGLSPIITVPELIRTDWTAPCQTFAQNPGNYQFKVWNWVPGQNLPLMTLGVYANASNFSTAADGLNLLTFPLHVTGIGFTQVPSLATWTSPESDTVVHVGQISFSNDMRELWVAPDLKSPGYDPDPGVDKRITVSIQPILPLDPMRRDAVDSGDHAWWVGAMVPNSSDEHLTAKYASTYGVTDDSWDDRFVRNSAYIASGAMTGYGTGTVLFGLQLNNMKIDDQDFTTFEVGYMASVKIGTWSKKAGSSQWSYWSNVRTDTDRFGGEMTFVPSNYGDTTIIKWNQSTETGGAVNYVTLVAFLRGLSVTNPRCTPIGTDGTPTGENLGLHSRATNYAESGVSVKVQHVGPIENYTTTIATNHNHLITKALFVERLLDLPEAISPAPDTYFYPAPQWGGTVGASIPHNRNGEMRHQFTYSTAPDSSKWITRTGSGLNRRYFKFKVPGFVPPSPSDSPDYFTIDLSTAPHGLRSAKTGVNGTHGEVITGSPSVMNDAFGHFQTQGVVAGDSVWIYKGYAAPAVCTITEVVSQTQIQWDTCTGTAPTDGTYRKYYIKRSLGDGPTGECLIDQYYGGAAFRESGGGCVSIYFWHFYGPITLGASSVQVEIPEITPGAATLNGVSGVVPDAWEGIPSNTLMNSVWWFPPRLAWAISIMNVDSGSTSAGGLGGPLNWNNQNFWSVDYATNMMGSDSHFFYIDFTQ